MRDKQVPPTFPPYPLFNPILSPIYPAEKRHPSGCVLSSIKGTIATCINCAEEELRAHFFVESKQKKTNQKKKEQLSLFRNWIGLPMIHRFRSEIDVDISLIFPFNSILSPPPPLSLPRGVKKHAGICRFPRWEE